MIDPVLLLAVIGLLRMVGEVLTASITYLIKPTKENAAKLAERVTALKKAWLQLKLDLDKAIDQLQAGNVENLEKDANEYASKLNEQFVGLYGETQSTLDQIEANTPRRDIAATVKSLRSELEELAVLWAEIQKLIRDKADRLTVIKKLIRLLRLVEQVVNCTLELAQDVQEKERWASA